MNIFGFAETFREKQEEFEILYAKEKNNPESAFRKVIMLSFYVKLI